MASMFKFLKVDHTWNVWKISMSQQIQNQTSISKFHNSYIRIT